jgi:predicted DNA-binding transcriptional regulator YafY
MLTENRKKKDRPAGISEKVTRLLEIYSLIAENRYPTLNFLAEHFNVTRRTVLRYLEIIRAIDTVDFDPDRKGYFFPTGSRVKKLVISGDDLATILTASEAVSHLGKTFQNNFIKLTERMFAGSSNASLDRKQSIIIRSPQAVQGDTLEESLRILPVCIQEKRSVDIIYHTRGNKKETARTVDPYGLVLYEGIWILIGFCNLRKQIRSFALDRIAHIEERNRYFTPRDDFSLEDYLSHTWGIIDGEEEKIVVRFKKEAADYILRRESWHPSEKRKVLPDGGVELTFVVAGTLEVKKWIYSWLPYVEVIKPLSLRRQVRQELAEAAATHLK